MNGLRRALIGLGVAAVAAGAVSAILILTSDHGDTKVAHAIFVLLIGWSFAGTGLFAWWRRPNNRTGALMTAVGFAWFIQGLQGSDYAWLFILGVAFGPIVYAPLTHMLVAFPDGRLTTRLHHWVVALVWIDVTVFQFAAIFFADPSDSSDCQGCPDNPLLITASKGAVNAISTAQTLLAIAVLTALIVAIRRRWRDTPEAQRGPLAPVLFAGALTLIAEIIVLSVDVAGVGDGIVRGVYIVALVILASVPFAFLFGLLKTRLSRAGAVSELVARLGERGARRPSLRDALADALRDPTLSVVYWLPDRERYVDADGRPVDLPEPGSGRAWTAVARDGEPLAAIIHDPALNEERELIDTAGAAAALVLENERLDAEVRARVEELSRSRRRLIEVGLAERRGSGARPARRGAAAPGRPCPQPAPGADRLDEDPGGRAGPARRGAGRAGAGDGRAARAGPRASTRRCSPTAAWPRRSTRSPAALRSPSSVVQTPDERLPAPVETAAYYVVAEALTNVARYAGANRAEVRVTRDNGRVTVEVSDDGVGGADPAEGSGLRGLADRRRRPRRPPRGREPGRRGDARSRAADPVRVVLAEDSVLLREGVARLLEDAGHRGRRPGRRRRGPAAQGPRAQARRGAGRHPHAAHPHRRGPPGGAGDPRGASGHRRARALAVRRGGLRDGAPGRRAPRGSGTSSRTASPTSSGSSTRCAAWPRAAPRWTPRSCRQMLGRRRADDPLDELTPREREVIGLMAEGRSNGAIAEEMVITERAVEKHVTGIFGKLDLEATPQDHRRVLAVLTYLKA